MKKKFVISVATNINGYLNVKTMFATTQQEAEETMHNLLKEYEDNFESDTKKCELPNQCSLYILNDNPNDDSIYNCVAIIKIGQVCG